MDINIFLDLRDKDNCDYKFICFEKNRYSIFNWDRGILEVLVIDNKEFLDWFVN